MADKVKCQTILDIIDQHSEHACPLLKRVHCASGKSLPQQAFEQCLPFHHQAHCKLAGTSRLQAPHHFQPAHQHAYVQYGFMHHARRRIMNALADKVNLREEDNFPELNSCMYVFLWHAKMKTNIILCMPIRTPSCKRACMHLTVHTALLHPCKMQT